MFLGYSPQVPIYFCSYFLKQTKLCIKIFYLTFIHLLSPLYLQFDKTFPVNLNWSQLNHPIQSLKKWCHHHWTINFRIRRSIRALHISAQDLKSPNKPKCAQARFTQATLNSTKLILDVVHAVSWLPRGWLWGGSLQTTQAAGVATLSAVLGLVIHYNGKRLLPR